jgi:hypothetical protein
MTIKIMTRRITTKRINRSSNQEKKKRTSNIKITTKRIANNSNQKRGEGR